VNLEHMIQEQRYGKDNGEQTPPILQLLNKCMPLSDSAPLVATPSSAKVLIASSFLVPPAKLPTYRLGTRRWIQPLELHIVHSSALLVICIAMARPVYRYMWYLPPLATAADASIASKVVVPYTGDAYCALQPFSAQSALVLLSDSIVRLFVAS
jgi:hypothetical protein